MLVALVLLALAGRGLAQGATDTGVPSVEELEKELQDARAKAAAANAPQAKTKPKVKEQAAAPAPAPRPKRSATPTAPSDTETATAPSQAPPAPTQAAGTVFKDCSDCPDMVVIPAGSFTMGSPPGEAGREDYEGPQHHVSIAAGLAVSKYEVTRGQFAEFVAETGRSPGECQVWDGKDYQIDQGHFWHNQPNQRSNQLPVVCVNWFDAQAYVHWLSGKANNNYRLLTEAEWEYVARAGTSTSRYWGADAADQCTYANGADSAFKASHPNANTATCSDGYEGLAPVGSFRPNAFGLYDMLGNASEWVEDCALPYSGQANDGTAQGGGGQCESRVLRGGGWDEGPRKLRSAGRSDNHPFVRTANEGFRVARTEY